MRVLLQLSLIQVHVLKNDGWKCFGDVGTIAIRLEIVLECFTELFYLRLSVAATWAEGYPF